MFLRSLATATPSRSLTQAECLEIARSSPVAGQNLDRRSRLLLSSILRGDSGIDRRQFAVRDVKKLFHLDADELNEEFRQTAPRLAVQALGPALEQAEIAPRELDALVVCTCTGYLCPGVSSYAAEILGLRSDAWLQDLVGLGCGAAIPSLRAVSAVLAANPSARVACVAVEVCSAAFYLDNDPGVIISACLFGDGAAASIWQGKAAPDAPLRCHSFDTHHAPESRDRIRFEQRGGKLRNLLHSSVPSLAAGAVKQLHDRASAAVPTRLGRILCHAGGKDVLAALQDRFPEEDFAIPREILRRHGNMSSPSVLFALAEALKDSSPNRDADWWLVSFGAGFSAHSCRISLA
jgi:alkylresorcinol/alkylpyrone synthase